MLLVLVWGAECVAKTCCCGAELMMKQTVQMTVIAKLVIEMGDVAL
jgi:hypothetical protein